MTIGELIYATLGPLVAGRCYPLEFPQRPNDMTWPAIRYTVVSLVPTPSICGDSGIDASDIRVQLDVVGPTYDVMTAIARQVAAAMAELEGDAYPATLDLWQETSDPDTGTFSAVLDYLVAL